MFINAVIEAAHLASDRVKRNPRLRAMIERTRNKRYFTDLEIHDRMLADSSRVDAYHRAIQKYVTEEDIVVDLGTGTGILAFFAAKQGAKRIYALDHSDVIKIAEYLAQENKFDNVSFVKKHSADFSPDEKVNIIVHEQMGSKLFNEYMITNVCDLRDRILAEGGKILPAKFDLYLEPVSLKDDYKMPFLWENDLHGVKLNGIKKWIEARSGETNAPRISTHRRILPCEVDYLLSEPEKIFSLDLYTASPAPVSYNWRQRKKMIRGGRLDGFCLYFKVIFDDEVSISTSPFARRTNWDNHFIRTEGLDLKEGDELDVEWAVSDLCNVRSWVPKIARAS